MGTNSVALYVFCSPFSFGTRTTYEVRAAVSGDVCGWEGLTVAWPPANAGTASKAVGRQGHAEPELLAADLFHDLSLSFVRVCAQLARIAKVTRKRLNLLPRFTRPVNTSS